MYGGLKCSGCGNEKLEFSVGYSGADWDCQEGEGSGYGHEVSLICPECGRAYTICHCKNSWDVSPVLGAFLGTCQDGSEIYAEKR